MAGMVMPLDLSSAWMDVLMWVSQVRFYETMVVGEGGGMVVVVVVLELYIYIVNYNDNDVGYCG